MIKWITSELGTAALQNVKNKSGIVIVDVRSLVDKKGNRISAVKKMIETALIALNQKQKTVICCDYGMSRSNAVAAGILALRSGIDFENALQAVLSATGEKNIQIEVVQAVREAVDLGLIHSSCLSIQRRVLLTGGKGFIGRGLGNELNDRNIHFQAPASKDLDLVHDIVKTDLIVKEQSIDTLIHLANPRIYTTNEALGVGLTMLKNVLDICALNNLRLIFVSSWVIYSGYRGELKADEFLPPNPKGSYAQSKALCEQLINYYRQNGLNCIILRAGNVYGREGDAPRFIWNFKEKAIKNDVIITHQYINGFPALDLLHVSDMRRAIALAVESDVTGDFNIGTGELLTTSWMAEHVVKTLGSESKISHMQIHDHVGNIAMDFNKAKNLLGWKPHTTFIEGVKEILEFYEE